MRAIKVRRPWQTTFALIHFSYFFVVMWQTGRTVLNVCSGATLGQCWLNRLSATAVHRRGRRQHSFFSTSSSHDGVESENDETSTSTACPGSIYNPPSYSIPNLSSQVTGSIRCSLVGVPLSPQECSRDTGMSLIFLGTSAGLPTRGRGPTSTLLRLGGESLLVDAGEGVQRQLMFTRAKPTHIDRIFITHLHGDHLFGLPGLLLGLQHSYQIMSQQQPKLQQDKKKKRNAAAIDDRVVKIYGPPGLYNYVAANIILSCTLFHSLNIEIHELVGGRVRRTHGQRDAVRNPFEADYPELNFGRLTRHSIRCDDDGVWTIEDLPSILTREDILSPNHNFRGRKSSSSSSSRSNRFRIQAAEVDHLSGVVTFGYSIQEEEYPRNIDAAKAKELGVSPAGKKYDLLKAGFSVLTDDGSQTVQPSQVVLERRKKARKITLVGDNRGWTSSMKHIAQDSDVLVHEATLMDKDSADWQRRGHSTAAMAGKMSGQVNAKLLVLNHISPKADYLKEDGTNAHLGLITNAKEASNYVSEAIVAYDFMEILVPWLGFGEPASNLHAEDEAQDGNAFSKHESASKLNGEDGETMDTKDVLKQWFAPKRQ